MAASMASMTKLEVTQETPPTIYLIRELSVLPDDAKCGFVIQPIYSEGTRVASCRPINIFTCGYAGIVIVSFPSGQVLKTVYIRPMGKGSYVTIGNKGQIIQICGQH